MEALVRSTTLRYSHRRTDGYEPLNPAGDQSWRRRDGGGSDDGGQGEERTFSRPRSVRRQVHNNPVMTTSFSYRRNRARQRQIFLRTYKLESMDASRKSCKDAPKKLKKFVVKVKTVMISVLSFMRANTLKSCNSGSAICAASPSRMVKIC